MARRSSVTDRDTGYARLKRQLAILAAGQHVVIGIRGEKGTTKGTRTVHHKDGSETEEKDSLTLVEIAAVNEYGSEDGHIPERSFLRATFDKNRGKYEKVFRKALGRVIDGKTEYPQELAIMGVRVAGDVQKWIGEFTDPPNAQMTIDRKGSSGPLRDTGRLRASLDSEVREDE